ncbi:hypothetical protein ACPCHT_17820 [Nucisporomicrobium flavum]|uniref:hypothetical protein n=1 Tax=Nucisporomicrobium flavum TaxID=2785915 RepID=UPI003C30315A
MLRLNAYGATSPLSVWNNIQNPVTGYLNKFDVYQQSAGNSSSPWLVLLFPFGVLGTALVPLLVIHWRDLYGWPRVFGIAGVTLHLSFYLFIGTMKGIGDLVVMLAGAAMIAMSKMQPRRRSISPRGRALLAIAGIFAILVVFMINNHGSRAEKFGTAGILMETDPALTEAVGPFTADGLTDVISYPTHGYLGLSFNLGTPFSWSRGLGSSPAAAMFAEQNLGIKPEPTYPERTEYRTWWPAQRYWATIYPWLASDLTFPGALLFMGLAGWLFASSWHRSISTRRIVPILMFCQLCILILYVPANNQLGMTLESIVGMATLLIIHTARSLPGPRQSGEQVG